MKWQIVLIVLLYSQRILALSPIVVALSSAPNNLVPFYSTDANSQNINQITHVALVKLNSKMKYVCDACLSFTEKISNKKHIISFKLKNNITFSDGTNLDASSVINSWKLFTQNKQIKSTFMESFENLEAVNEKSQYEVDLIYKNFSLENISNLSLLKLLKIKGNDYEHLDFSKIIGAGEYQVKKVLPLEIEIESSNKDKSKIIFKVVKDETTLALKLLNHEIDLSVASMSPRKVNWLREKKNLVNVWNLPSANYIFLGMNQKKAEFKKIEIRKALSLLIPRSEILKYKLKNNAVLSTGMFSPAFENYYKNIPIDSYNPNEAQALFKKVGYVLNREGKLEKDKNVLVIDWKVSNNKSSIEMVDLIKNYLEKAGLVVNVSVLEWGTYMSNFKAGKFDMVMGQWIGFTGPDMLRFVFHSENTPPKGGNRIRYNNPRFDEVINQATIETLEAKRNFLYNEADKIVTNDYAYISLWHPNVVWIASKCLRNLELEPTGSFISFPNMEKVCE